MTSNDTSADQIDRWEEVTHNWGAFARRHIYEAKPYQECPNCGEIGYTKLKDVWSGVLTLIVKPDPDFWHQCEECGYIEGDRPSDIYDT